MRQPKRNALGILTPKRKFLLALRNEVRPECRGLTVSQEHCPAQVHVHDFDKEAVQNEDAPVGLSVQFAQEGPDCCGGQVAFVRREYGSGPDVLCRFSVLRNGSRDAHMHQHVAVFVLVGDLFEAIPETRQLRQVCAPGIHRVPDRRHCHEVSSCGGLRRAAAGIGM